jgi:hypothetical protein
LQTLKANAHSRKPTFPILLHASFIGAGKVEIDFAQVTVSDWTPDPVIP